MAQSILKWHQPILAVQSCSAAEVPDPEEILKSSNIDLSHAERLGFLGGVPSMAMAGKHRGLEQKY